MAHETGGKPTPEVARRLFESDGWSRTDIAQHYGVSLYTLADRLFRAGLDKDAVQKIENQRSPKVTDEELLNLHEKEGLPLRTISERTGLGYGTVHRRLRALGVDTSQPVKNTVEMLMHLHMHEGLPVAEVARHPQVIAGQRTVYQHIAKEKKRRQNEGLPEMPDREDCGPCQWRDNS